MSVTAKKPQVTPNGWPLPEGRFQQLYRGTAYPNAGPGRALQPQQRGLRGGAADVPADAAVRPQHPVARHDDQQGVARARRIRRDPVPDRREKLSCALFRSWDQGGPGSRSDVGDRRPRKERSVLLLNRWPLWEHVGHITSHLLECVTMEVLHEGARLPRTGQ